MYKDPVYLFEFKAWHCFGDGDGVEYIAPGTEDAVPGDSEWRLIRSVSRQFREAVKKARS